jgi:hypothetical protein
MLIIIDVNKLRIEYPRIYENLAYLFFEKLGRGCSKRIWWRICPVRGNLVVKQCDAVPHGTD